MKHWKETAEILRRFVELAEAGRQAAVATVVRIKGSAYRRPGAKFLVEDDGHTSGSVSGGCLEADVRESALEAMRIGAPRLIHYETGSDDRTVWGLGLGCNGSVDIFVQPGAEGEALETVRRAAELLAGDDAFTVSTAVKGPAAGRAIVLSAQGVLAGSTADPELDREMIREARDVLARRASTLRAIGASEVFTEILVPPPNLVLFGAGDDAIPLCAYASSAGFRVSIVDHRAAYLSADRFPGAARLVLRRPEDGTASLPVGPSDFAVVKTHSFGHDREWTRLLLASGVSYIGLLGPRARSQEIQNRVGAPATGRIYGPVGLDLGADGPEQVALSIVAELLAVKSEREPWPLREKEGAIHAT